MTSDADPSEVEGDGRESTLYAPGIGLVADASLVRVSYTKR